MFLNEYEYCLAESILNRKDTKKTRFPLLFSYTGTGQSFTIPAAGTYCFECWGASSVIGPTGHNTGTPGYGGYAAGNIELDANTLFYIFVGEKGHNDNSTVNTGGWNGGGASGRFPGHTGSGGGGSTDIRLAVKNASDLSIWQDDVSLRSRIIVAGGGGGSCDYYSGGYAGGIEGGPGKTTESGYTINKGGTQVSGGTLGNGPSSALGLFGYAYQVTSNTSNYNANGGGGGGGYWGGSRGYGTGGAGGSSYISGHPGCIAVTSASSTSPVGGNNTTTNLTRERASHYSGNVFVEGSTVIIDGEGYNWTLNSRDASAIGMPTTFLYDSNNKEYGHVGHGFARITQISTN